MKTDRTTVSVLERDIYGYAPTQSPEARQRHKPLKRKSAEKSRRVLTEIDKTNPWEAIVRRDPAMRIFIEQQMKADGWSRSSNKPGKASGDVDFERFMLAMRSVPAQGENQ